MVKCQILFSNYDYYAMASINIRILFNEKLFPDKNLDIYRSQKILKVM